MENDKNSEKVYGSFDSLETAQKATGGRVYEFRGHEKEAVILEDRNGRNWVYVTPESKKYRDIGNEIWGSRMSADGKDADHIASRQIEINHGQKYVLLGAVDRSANRSHGTYEKPGRYLDRTFNVAAQQTEPDRLAAQVSYRQSHKVDGTGKTALEADKDLLKARQPGVGDREFDMATFGGEKHQERLQSLKGKEFTFKREEVRRPDYVTRLDRPLSLATGGKTAMDRHRAEKSQTIPKPDTPTKSK